MKTRLLRSEVPIEQTWKLEDLFETEQHWKDELQAIEQDLPSVTKYKGKLSEGASTLLACLTAEEELMKRFMRVFTYANLRSSEDGTDALNQANHSLAAALHSKANAAMSFIKSEILSLTEGTVFAYLKDEPELKPFEKTLLDILEEKPYSLSPETEAVLAALGQVHTSPYTVYSRSKLSDMQFDPIVDAQGNEQPVSFALYEDHYESSPDTDLRRKAFGSFTKTLKQYKNTFATTFATEVQKQVVLSKLRSYESVTHMLLHPQKVTLEMYHNQLDIIQTELAPHMRRYAQLKKRILGLDKMMFCDLRAPLDPEFSPATTYEEASKTILEALSVMGPEYTEIMEQALTERWVDLADNVGKATGAFCASPYGVHPYILITWTDTMRGAFVLAHELGHAGHFALAGRNQRMVNTRPSLYFIEAPSTMNEMLLRDYLLANSTDNRMRRWIILQSLGTYYHNFVTHLLEAELQRRIYTHAQSGNPITANTLTEQKGDILSSFWGDTVDIDEGAALTWMRQPHYYMGLYPYTYSAGLTASTAAAEQIKVEGKPAVDRWLSALKAGGTENPLDLMKMAGVDMSQPDPIRKAVAYVGSLVDELEKSYE
ncbi:oligoendopeptidase F [Bacillus horti]|uniref:Oligopeptidase F n=1 Tax=Caldalkalibacillus horti TaxID=77523 RepID=A0ABT9VY29_9BACI|nr:oligoendopeptidase F [Bacillus horti]MDQ0165896.1 oligoendopeptidase F [Bacillus horti]